jgi:hypothetical protein
MKTIHADVWNEADTLSIQLKHLINNIKWDKTSVKGHINADVTDKAGEVLCSVLRLWKAMQEAYPDADLVDLGDYMRVFYKEEK